MAEEIPSRQERLTDELALLRAAYPEQIEWHARNREMTFTITNDKAKLLVRIPDNYLGGGEAELPQIVLSTCGQGDLRSVMQSWLQSQEPDVELLYLIVEEFHNAVVVHKAESESVKAKSACSGSSLNQASTTIVIWLHHLLNMNKRKQAASPSSAEVSGFTKPGYPGVLLYAGPVDAVNVHVQELKALNWQAFQVRLEADTAWPLAQSGVKEVESMSEIVSSLDEAHKQEFLAAIMKI